MARYTAKTYQKYYNGALGGKEPRGPGTPRHFFIIEQFQ